MGYGREDDEILYDVTAIAILEDEKLNKLKQFCLGRVPSRECPTPPSIRLKLTYPWDIGALSPDSTIKTDRRGCWYPHPDHVHARFPTLFGRLDVRVQSQSLRFGMC